MPSNTQSADFWGWYLRHNNRLVWRHMADAGIDVFSVGPNSNEQSFLDLTNILPAITGGLNRRWGISQAGSGVASSGTNIVRTFLYNNPQDLSNPTTTANTNLIIGTDNQHFYTFTDSFAAYSGYGPSNFAHSGVVNCATSRGWLYYGNGVDTPRKVNPSVTGSNTDSNLGIALPTAVPGSTTYTDYPCVILPTVSPTGGTAGSISMTSGGYGFTGGTAYNVSGGTGSGMVITVNSVTSGFYLGSYVTGIVTSYSILNWGTGYLVGDTISLAGGSASCNFSVLAVPSSTTSGSGSGCTGLGYTPINGSFTTPVYDSQGSGTGGIVTCYTDSNGAIYKAAVSSAGSGYVQAYVTLALPSGAGAKQGYLVLYTQTNASASHSGQVVGVDIAGPMTFVQGRQYVVALQNSATGHTSDVFVDQLPTGATSGSGGQLLFSAYDNLITSTATNVPSFFSTANQTAGFTQISLTVSVPATGLDPQVDTVILLATADGQSLGTLYQVATFPLSSFTLSGGFYTLHYYDSLPDSYNSATNIYGIGNTLLEANLWAYTDASGDTFGILLNTPPPANGFLYPTLHQGRMFATDGKTLFYSKSLDEVTTSTGLITSKWEECWPGDYQLPIALNNETIIGLKSDGTNLHVGTDKSIFTVYGDSPSNFAVPSVAFAQTGIFSHDCWTVIYAEGMPSGFVWITQDFKVIHSDFSTYREIGTSIYPFLKNLDLTKKQNMKITSLTQGPYNYVVLQLFSTNSSNPQPEFWIWETRLQKWYHWVLPATETTPSSGVATVPSSFVYQFPAYTASSFAAGSKFLFYWRQYNAGTNTLQFRYFNPSGTQDLVDTTQNIPWAVQTAWQDCGDSTAIKVSDEIEFTSDDAPLTVSLYGATSQSQFGAGGTLLKTGSSVTGPISSLGVNKFFCAGAQTAAKYYSLRFAPISPGTSPNVLTSFDLYTYPMARI